MENIHYLMIAVIIILTFGLAVSMGRITSLMASNDSLTVALCEEVDARNNDYKEAVKTIDKATKAMFKAREELDIEKAASTKLVESFNTISLELIAVKKANSFYEEKCNQLEAIVNGHSMVKNRSA